MAHVVGVPKRDPCRKCQLPVFLAERLTVGKKVYHRTCLKCARCGYQLTPGSFYETEIDEQYCCETCPDEEATLKNTEKLSISSEAIAADCSNVDLRNADESETNVLRSPAIKSVRSSIKERLAFFENHGEDHESESKLLQKSLSDEEKSKSLKRVECSPESFQTTYKSNVALSKFLQGANEKTPSEPSFSTHISKMESSDSEDDSDDLGFCSAPELPKTLPPSQELNLDNKTDEKTHFTVSAQLVLGSPPITLTSTTEKADEQENFVQWPVKENQLSEMHINLKSNAIDNTNNNNNNTNNEEDISGPVVKFGCIEDKEAAQLQPKKLEDSIEFSETNDNDCITKEKSADGFATQTPVGDLQKIHSNENQVISENETTVASITEHSQNNSTNVIEENSNDSLELQDNKTTELLTVIHTPLPQLEVEKEDAASPKTSHEINVVGDEIVTNEDFKSIKNNFVAGNGIHNSKEDIRYKLTETEAEADSKDKNATSTLVTKIEKETEILKTTFIDNEVPSTVKTNENVMIESNLDDKKEEQLEQLECDSKENINDIQPTIKTNNKTSVEEYPEDLNPFKSDEENEENIESKKENVKKDNLNPFDSSDDEVELEKCYKTSPNSRRKIPPPRPPPPRISKNPFGSEDEDDATPEHFTRRSSLTGSQSKKTPVPHPRSKISQSLNLTPEPTPRRSTKANATIGNSPISSASASASASATPNNSSFPLLQNSGKFYGSANSLYSNSATPHNLSRSSETRSSNNSLNLSSGGTIRSRKSRRAPLPPAPVRELFPSNESIESGSKASTPSSSTVGTPKSCRKKRPAPAPPKPASLEHSSIPQIQLDAVNTHPKNLNNYPLQSELDSKLSDEEKALLEGKILQSLHNIDADLSLSPSSRQNFKRLIPLDQELLEEHGTLQHVEENSSHCDDLKQQNQQKYLTVHEVEPSIVYRRVLIPQNLETPTHEHNLELEDLSSKSPALGERQLEKLKDNKEANNRNRQSQISVTSSGADDNDPLFNKSAHGKWKRRKGPAPALPIPPRKVLQMLPLQEIKHELEIIEVQQQGLEKQGVILEKMIRDRCEGENGEPLNTDSLPGDSGDSASGSSTAANSKEVENLILQLFELVNEKNELFRRQAELMYLRRQHRLEQEQADLEYEIRILMAQPERNKTDSDKAREEALIERLVEVVQLRNEVVECLEMDRLREAEEDQSIKQRLESHIAKRDVDSNSRKTLTKLSKKEKKKQKESKKLFKSKKIDADKDADESELNVDKMKSKKKKKLIIF